MHPMWAIIMYPALIIIMRQEFFVCNINHYFAWNIFYTIISIAKPVECNHLEPCLLLAKKSKKFSKYVSIVFMPQRSICSWYAIFSDCIEVGRRPWRVVKRLCIYKPPSKSWFHWGRPYSVINEIALYDRADAVPWRAMGRASCGALFHNALYWRARERMRPVLAISVYQR